MRYIAHLIGHPASISIYCGCTEMCVVKPGYLLDRLGMEATIEDAERRLRCPKCKQRPTLKLRGDYAVTGGRDLRRDPPPMPNWVDLT